MDLSVRQSVDPVHRGVHGPGVSVFGSPVVGCFVFDFGCFVFEGCFVLRSSLSSASFSILPSQAFGQTFTASWYEVLFPPNRSFDGGYFVDFLCYNFSMTELTVQATNDIRQFFISTNVPCQCISNTSLF